MTVSPKSASKGDTVTIPVKPDRGYVLDQGRNAYSGKGRDLMNDPKVVSLYLGNLEEEVQEEGR